MIRRAVISLSVAVYAFFAFSEIAQVNPLYKITFEDTKEYITGDLEVTMMACRAECSGEENYTAALAEYRNWHNYIKNKYSGMKGINEAIKVSSLAAWDSAMNDILLSGISAQIYIDAQEVEAATGESNELSAEAKKISLEKSTELQKQITSLESQTQGISGDLESLASSTTTSLEELSKSNQTVTATLQEQIIEKAKIASQATSKLKEALDAKAAGDETKYQSLWQEYSNLKLEEAICDENIAYLKKEQTNISTTINGLTQASSLAVTTAAKLKEVAMDATYAKTMIDFKLSGSDWRNASMWLGYNPTTDETVLDITNSLNVFFTPKRFRAYEQGETPTFYNISEGNRIFNLLSDMGYVTAVDEDMDEAYTQTAYQKTKYRFQLAANPSDITRTNTTANFSAPANWVDQVTIKTNANNEYYANGTPVLNDSDIDDPTKTIPPHFFYQHPDASSGSKTNTFSIEWTGNLNSWQTPLNWSAILEDDEEQQASDYGLLPKRYFLLTEEVTGGFTRTNCYTDAHDSEGKPTKDATGAYNNLFPPPRNWVDGTSIVCTDGVYRAGSAITNLMKGLEAEARRKGGGSGGRSVFRTDPEVKLDDPSDPLNPNSVKFPGNAGFDPSDVDNEWYHVFPHTDSEVTEQYWNTDFGTFKSIADLGKFSDVSTHNLTNVLGLQNFVYAFPFMIPWTFGIHESGHGGYNASELMWAQTTNCFETISDESASKFSKSAYSFNLKGFDAATEWQVPYKHKTESKNPDGSDHYDIAWTNAQSLAGFMYAFDGAKIINCKCQVGSQIVSCADVSVSAAGTYYAHITWSGSTATLTVDTTSSGEGINFLVQNIISDSSGALISNYCIGVMPFVVTYE